MAEGCCVGGRGEPEASRTLCAYLMESAIQRLPEGNESVLGIFDFGGAGPQNIDLEFARFLVSKASLIYLLITYMELNKRNHRICIVLFSRQMHLLLMDLPYTDAMVKAGARGLSNAQEALQVSQSTLSGSSHLCSEIW